jgi:DNA-binding NarL/FixJ family response regulator
MTMSSSSYAPAVHVAIADAMPIVRDGINALIQSYTEIVRDIEAGSDKELLTKLRQTKPLPHVCIMDINICAQNGYEIIRTIKEQWPEMKVLVYTNLDFKPAIAHMARCGADGYLHKCSESGELIRAAHAVNREEFFFPRHVTSQIQADDKNKIPSVSEKEMTFLGLCCTDLTYKEIADRMAVKARAVEGYHNSLSHK